MVSLAAYYSVYQSQMIGTFDPKGDLNAYKAMVEKQPNLKCDCQRQYPVPRVCHTHGGLQRGLRLGEDRPRS